MRGEGESKQSNFPPLSSSHPSNQQSNSKFSSSARHAFITAAAWLQRPWAVSLTQLLPSQSLSPPLPPHLLCTQASCLPPPAVFIQVCVCLTHALSTHTHSATALTHTLNNNLSASLKPLPRTPTLTHRPIRLSTTCSSSSSEPSPSTSSGGGGNDSGNINNGGGGRGDNGDGQPESSDNNEGGQSKSGIMKGWEERVAYDPELPVKVAMEQVCTCFDWRFAVFVV